MKKLLLLILAFLPLSVFAWADTDKICADDSKRWKLTEEIHINYPWRSTYVKNVFKVWYSTKENDSEFRIDRNKIPSNKMLYYIVNSKLTGNDYWYTRAELYSYDCISKIPKRLSSWKLADNMWSMFSIDYYQYWTFVISEKLGLYNPAPTLVRLTLYDVYGWKLFLDTKLFPGWSWWYINAFVDSELYWYFPFSGYDFDRDKLYRIDKTTKEITKL